MRSWHSCAGQALLALAAACGGPTTSDEGLHTLGEAERVVRAGTPAARVVLGQSTDIMRDSAAVWRLSVQLGIDARTQAEKIAALVRNLVVADIDMASGFLEGLNDPKLRPEARLYWMITLSGCLAHAAETASKPETRAYLGLLGVRLSEFMLDVAPEIQVSFATSVLELSPQWFRPFVVDRLSGFRDKAAAVNMAARLLKDPADVAVVRRALQLIIELGGAKSVSRNDLVALVAHADERVRQLAEQLLEDR